MSDAEWAVVRDAMPIPAWMNGKGGQPECYCLRQMLDAVRYLVAGGITWRAMPGDFPVWDRVYAFARRWGVQGLLAELHDRLRGLVREEAGLVRGADVRVVVPLAPTGTRLRDAAHRPRVDGHVVDDHAHEPQDGPSASVNRRGAVRCRVHRVDHA
ncbi:MULTISPECIES: transposase [unclassified Streptomyces]|uniref:transposase n=1 Tax=unclassified Streptomyces TaxID=2593676 RepID=UPI00382D93D4